MPAKRPREGIARAQRARARAAEAEKKRSVAGAAVGAAREDEHELPSSRRSTVTVHSMAPSSPRWPVPRGGARAVPTASPASPRRPSASPRSRTLPPAFSRRRPPRPVSTSEGGRSVAGSRISSSAAACRPQGRPEADRRLSGGPRGGRQPRGDVRGLPGRSAACGTAPGASLPVAPDAPLPMAPGASLPMAPGASLPMAPGASLPMAPGACLAAAPESRGAAGSGRHLPPVPTSL